MLFPLRDPRGTVLPTTAAGSREMPMIPNPGSEFPVDDAPNPRTPLPGGMEPSPGGMTDIPYQPPKRPDALPGSPVIPFLGTTDIPRMPAARSTPRSDRLTGGNPAVLVSPDMPLDVPSEPAPSSQGATPVTPAPEAGPAPGVDMREYLRAAGATFLRSSSPAKQQMGLQMLFEASQPTPGEVATAERKRMRSVVDSANVDPDMQHAAGIAADLGGNAELIMKSLGLDPESRAKKDKAKQHGTEVLDKAYAPKYVEFKLQDQSSMTKSFAQLQDVQNLLAQPGVKLTGPWQGMVPDSLKAFFPAGQRAITARELTEEVIQQSLRQILGAQFTQKEGESLMARTFNDKVSPEENMLRGQRFMQQIAEAYQDQASAAQYFEENGTLGGFKGRPVPTLADIENRARDDARHPARKSATAQSVNQGAKQAPTMKRPDLDNAAILQQAQEAIKAGKNPALIAKQLEEWGVPVE